MTILTVSGDPTLTRAQILAFGWNVLGRSETNPLAMTLQDRYPAAFASFGKRARNGSIKTGTLWTWRETAPALGFMVVRESPYGTTRLRYVEAIAMTLARDYKREGIQTIALVLPETAAYDAVSFRSALDHWLKAVSLSVIVYEKYLPDVRADETPLIPPANPPSVQ